MATPDDKVHIEVNDARAGSEPHVVRYVLGVSLVLVILAFLAIWLIKAA